MYGTYIYIYVLAYFCNHLQSPLPKHTPQDFLSILYLDCLLQIHPVNLSSSHVSSSLTLCLCVCVSVCHVFVQSHQRAWQWKLATNSEVKVPWGYYIVYPVLGVLVLCCCAGACCLGRNAAQKRANTSSSARRNEEKEGSP